MSRIGKKPVPIPKGVEVNLSNDNNITVKGPKGELSRSLPPEMNIAIEGDQIVVTRPSDSNRHRALHGLTRSLLANMVEGVTKGFSKTLELVGVGYRAAIQGSNLVLTVGYSQPVTLEKIPGINFEVPAANKVVVSGIDKQLVGDVAARIRHVREPEPYKGKGIKYESEHIRRKVGKAGK